uniref:Nucleoside transporter/FeoB GTPase Gate domain-containing protein n=1 Tax=candidate division WOR-3 bacterium TaxID=2052148 RepID=A0A7C6A985_UNCW3
MVVQRYLLGLLNLGWKIFAILFVIFLILELVERFGLLTKGYKKIAPRIRFLGLSEEAVAPLLAGIFFGIIYGAGVIADLIKKQGLDKKQVLLVSVFLGMCHAIVEDTGLFLVLGANIFWLTIPRLIIALGVTFLTNKLRKDR